MVQTASLPLVIAHRGASGYRPEHTLAAYELAIDMGADYIEPDIVSTRDGQLIARHENEISQTTDVCDRQEFASRQTTKMIDGRAVTGWFTEDFTLGEMKSLRAKERLPFRNRDYDGQFEIPTLAEILTLAQQKSTETRRKIGIYPETKHPSYFRAIGLPLEEPLIKCLAHYGYCHSNDPIFIQSFEVANLQQLARMTELPLVQLFEAENQQPYDFVATGNPRTYGDLTAPEALAKVADYAQGIGVYKRLIVPVGDDGRLQSPTTLIEDAHRVGLAVHAWTFRRENHFLALDYESDEQAEYEQFYRLGVDGVFSDFPDTALAVRDRIFNLPIE